MPDKGFWQQSTHIRGGTGEQDGVAVKVEAVQICSSKKQVVKGPLMAQSAGYVQQRSSVGVVHKEKPRTVINQACNRSFTFDLPVRFEGNCVDNGVHSFFLAVVVIGA